MSSPKSETQESIWAEEKRRVVEQIHGYKQLRALNEGLTDGSQKSSYEMKEKQSQKRIQRKNNKEKEETFVKIKKNKTLKS